MALESINEKQEQSSPVSVLETFISDDISCPDAAEIDNCMNWQNRIATVCRSITIFFGFSLC